MRLIDSDKVIELISDMQKDYPITDRREIARAMRVALFDIRRMIDDQPTVSKKETVVGEWIPVSERLPKNEILVLVSALSYGENKVPFVDTMKMINGKWCSFEPYFGWEEVHCEITAWMPLPKPYDGGGNCCKKCNNHK